MFEGWLGRFGQFQPRHAQQVVGPGHKVAYRLRPFQTYVATAPQSSTVLIHPKISSTRLRIRWLVW
jgi:hypothetical protein